MNETTDGRQDVSANSIGDGAIGDEAIRVLSPEAKRALAEAEERRRLAAQNETDPRNVAPREVGGRKGPDPTRYGDWEKGGIVSDF
ncbi:MAG: DUF1674 domain-containing protein [Hyphomicrobiaceae bacterium]